MVWFLIAAILVLLNKQIRSLPTLVVSWTGPRLWPCAMRNAYISAVYYGLRCVSSPYFLWLSLALHTNIPWLLSLPTWQVLLLQVLQVPYLPAKAGVIVFHGRIVWWYTTRWFTFTTSAHQRPQYSESCWHLLYADSSYALGGQGVYWRLFERW